MDLLVKKKKEEIYSIIRKICSNIAFDRMDFLLSMPRSLSLFLPSSRFVILHRQDPRACYCILIEEFYTRFFPRCRDSVYPRAYAVGFAGPTNLNASHSWYPALMMPQLLHYWQRAFHQIPSASRRVTAACPPRNPIISLANTQFAETSLSHRRLHSARSLLPLTHQADCPTLFGAKLSEEKNYDEPRSHASIPKNADRMNNCSRQRESAARIWEEGIVMGAALTSISRRGVRVFINRR